MAEAPVRTGVFEQLGPWMESMAGFDVVLERGQTVTLMMAEGDSGTVQVSPSPITSLGNLLGIAIGIYAQIAGIDRGVLYASISAECLADQLDDLFGGDLTANVAAGFRVAFHCAGETLKNVDQVAGWFAGIIVGVIGALVSAVAIGIIGGIAGIIDIFNGHDIYTIDLRSSDPDEVAALISQWHDANARCRGGPGDDPATWEACDERSVLHRHLYELGWCYGRENEPGYMNDWHQCDTDSLRPVNDGTDESAELDQVRADLVDALRRGDRPGVRSLFADQATADGLLESLGGLDVQADPQPCLANGDWLACVIYVPDLPALWSLTLEATSTGWVVASFEFIHTT